MNQGINQELLYELEEAHGYFQCLILMLNNCESKTFIQNVIMMEQRSYDISMDAINKMTDSLNRYNDLYISNIDFFEDEYKMVIKLIMLYLVSIIMIKIFSTTLSSEKLNEMWYGMVGMLLGTVNTGIIFNNINHHRGDSEESRSLINEMKSLKEEYNKNFEIANREISYMISLNRNLNNSDYDSKKIVKIIKDM